MNKPIIFLILVGCLGFMGPISAGQDTSLPSISPKIQSGIIDLRKWNFEKDGIVNLSGPWRFYWQAFLDPNSSFSPATLQKHSHITVPGSWNGHEHDGKKISGHGFATYRLKVLLKPQEQRLALKLPDMATAYQVYVNGKLVYSSGLPGKTADTSIPYLSPNIVSFEADAGHLDILVHVSNFHHRQGGMWESVKLGGMDEMHAHQEKTLLFNFFLLGSIIIMGLYHIGLYWTRKDDKASLYFGIFCILMGARLLSTGQRYILNLVPGMDFEWLHKVIYVSFYMCVPFFAMYVKSLFSREFSGKIVSVAKILALVLSFLVFFTPARIYSFTMPAFQIFTLLLLFYGIWVVILSIKRARTDALIFLFGFLVLTGVTLNDILYTRQIIDTGHYFQIGFFIFIFTQAFIISKRFSMAFSIIENQSHELKTANTVYEQELTRRKKTEKSLIESEQKYRYLFENGADLLCIHDLDGNLTETNLCFRHEYGWTQEDLIGINIREIIPTRHRHKFDRYMGKIMTNGSDEGLVTGVKKSGEEVIAEYRNKLIYDSEGKPKSVQGTAKDVTKWFKAEKALRESKERYKGLVQYAPVGIYDADMLTLKFTSVNDVMCEYTGYTESEFLKLNPFDILSDDSQDALNELVEDVFSNKPKELSTEYKIKGKNNREFWVLANTKFFYEDGVPVRVMAVVHDLTEIRQAEEEKKKLEIQLQNAKKLEALGTLAGGVAHDLNNILSGVVSYPDLLLLDLDADSPLREPLLTIKKSGEKAADIVQDLLTLARRGVKSRQVINLNQVVHDFLDSPECDKLLSGQDCIRVETQLDEKLINILGSEVHILKSLMNIVSNAVDAMPAGGVVSISTKSRYLDVAYNGSETIPEGEYTILKVSDQGIGMPKSDLERIFEPFYTKKVMGRSGTGLGMSVVWGTVKDHDGFIDVITEEGLGTTFKLYFPITRRKNEDFETIYIEDYLGQGESILVIDDSKEQRELAVRMMQRLGYSAHMAISGEEALKMMNERGYDLLILDMLMPPGMNGLQTYKKILRIVPNQKAVIASGFAENDMVRETLELGAGSYVKKPYTLENIGLAVRSELDRKWGSSLLLTD